MAEMVDRAKDINDFFFQYLLTLATSAELSRSIGVREMRALKLALEMPLMSKEIEDKEVYVRLRKLMEDMRDVPSFHTEKWSECAKKTITMLLEEL